MMRPIYLIFFFLCSEVLFAQKASLDVSFCNNPFFVYDVSSTGDTVGVDFYLLKSKDSVNHVNKYGKRNGFWIDGYYSPWDYKLQMIKNLQNQDYSIIHPIPFSIDSVREIQLFLLNQSDSFKFIPTYNFYDLCLFPESNNEFKNGNYIEEYWFGYLIGKYKNGVKVGTWKFLPSFDRKIFNKIISVSDYSEFIDKRIRRGLLSFYNVNCFESGEYSNNQRNGLWIYATSKGFTRKSEYALGELFSTSIINNKNEVERKEYEIINEANKKILINYKYDTDDKIYVSGRFDISHIKRIKNIGERNYFSLFPISK